MANLKHHYHSTKLVLGFVLLMICWLAAPVGARASDEMTTEDAARLLKSHEMFAAVQSITLNTGTIRARLADIERYQPKYIAFKTMGLVDLTTITIESPDKDPKRNTEATRVSLTDRGVKESAAWKQEKENEWVVAIADRKLVEVMTIQKDGEGRIHGIEFSWTWAPNKIGEALKFSYPNERAYAKLTYDGKVWQIVSIRALG